MRLRGATKSPESEPEEIKRAARYKGALQGVGAGTALGWAADESNGDARVEVSLVVDGEIVAEGVADIARDDLVDSGHGDGAHGFLLKLPQHLQTPARRQIAVLAGPEQAPIPATPSFWQQPAANGDWSDVVFEPGGGLSASVPPPPPIAGDRAIVSDGWLLSFEEEEGRAAPEERAMDRLAALLTDNASRCAELGIAYIPALVPRKREVISAAPSPEREWVARLLARLRDIDTVELIDLLGVLRDGAARHGGAYHRTDADWNDRGAFYVARALLKEAHKRAPALRPPPLSQMHLRSVAEYRGTLAQAALYEVIAGELQPCAERAIEDEPGVVLDPASLSALRMPVEHALAQIGSVHLRVYAASHQDPHARLAILGDSAALALLPWLAEHTSRTTFFWTSELPLAQLRARAAAGRASSHARSEPRRQMSSVPRWRPSR